MAEDRNPIAKSKPRVVEEADENIGKFVGVGATVYATATAQYEVDSDTGIVSRKL